MTPTPIAPPPWRAARGCAGKRARAGPGRSAERRSRGSRPGRPDACSTICAVHHEQRLRGDRRRGAVAVGDRRVGKIERLEHIVKAPAKDGQIDAPPRRLIECRIASDARRRTGPETASCASSVPPIVVSSCPLTARIESRSSSASIRRRGIRHSNRSSGSTLRSPLIPGRAHLIGLREHDALMQRLERPAILDEPERQPVEQLRVRGSSPSLPKLSTEPDQPLAEMPSPDAVDDHPRGERVASGRSATGPARAGRSASGSIGG